MNKKTVILIFSILTALLLVSMALNLYYSGKSKESGQMLQGKTMWAMSRECNWNCSNYLTQKDFQNNTNFTNRCQEDCRQELDRVVAALKSNPNLDMEKNFEINFFRNYVADDRPITYKLINQDLGYLTGDKRYINTFAWHVYGAVDTGYRVVPFPYKQEGQQIVEVKNLEDIFFNKSGQQINCKTNVSNTQCQALKNLRSRDEADGMLLDCADQSCNFLEAVRTHNQSHCPTSPTDNAWILLCREMSAK